MHGINLTLGFMMKQKNGNEKKQQTGILTPVITQNSLFFLRKDTFHSVKDRLSSFKTRPFAVRKASFRGLIRMQIKHIFMSSNAAHTVTH